MLSAHPAYAYNPDGVGNRQMHLEKIGTTTTPYQYVCDELERLKEAQGWGESSYPNE